MPKLLINPINFVLIIITVARPVKFPYYEKSFRIIHVVIYCELYHFYKIFYLTQISGVTCSGLFYFYLFI